MPNRVRDAFQVGFESAESGLIRLIERRINLRGALTQIRMALFKLGQHFACRITSSGTKNLASPKGL